jgi:hypothetical protein
MVKKEEQEIRIAPAVLNASTSVNSRVKTEPIDHAQGVSKRAFEDVIKRDAL